MMGFLPILILLPIYVGIPALILYFVIKMAVKNAIKELKNENILETKKRRFYEKIKILFIFSFNILYPNSL